MLLLETGERSTNVLEHAGHLVMRPSAGNLIQIDQSCMVPFELVVGNGGNESLD